MAVDRSNWRIVRSRRQIARDVRRIAREIAKDYRGKPVVLVGVLNGACFFVTDLAQALFDLGVDAHVDFIGVESYGDNRQSSRNPRITTDLKRNFEGMQIIVCDELLDKGYTLKMVLEILRLRVGPEGSVRSCVCVIKKDACEEDVCPDYFGAYVPNEWLVGYGLDNMGLGRGCRDICMVVFD